MSGQRDNLAVLMGTRLAVLRPVQFRCSKNETHSCHEPLMWKFRVDYLEKSQEHFAARFQHIVVVKDVRWQPIPPMMR